MIHDVGGVRMNGSKEYAYTEQVGSFGSETLGTRRREVGVSDLKGICID
jgi:hypothetical protein